MHTPYLCNMGIIPLYTYYPMPSLLVALMYILMTCWQDAFQIGNIHILKLPSLDEFSHYHMKIFLVFYSGAYVAYLIAQFLSNARFCGALHDNVYCILHYA